MTKWGTSIIVFKVWFKIKTWKSANFVIPLAVSSFYNILKASQNGSSLGVSKSWEAMFHDAIIHI